MIKLRKKNIKIIDPKKTIDEYKKFAIKGNVIDLATGVIIGSAFTAIVNSLVANIITPVISLITNKTDISSLFFSITGGNFSSLEEAKAAGAVTINYGLFLNAIFNFFIVSFILFIAFKYINKLRKSNEPVDITPNTKECPYCFNTVNINATKCSFCTSDLNIIKEKKKKDLSLDIDSNLDIEKNESV